MKKLISFLVSSIFVFTSYTQVHMLLRANIKDTLVIDKYETQNNGFLTKQIFMSPGSWRIQNERTAELLNNETVVAVDLVYSDYPEGDDFTELNKRRIVELYNFLPTAFNRQVVNWRIIKQTGVIKTGGINNYFHGFVVYYRPMPTYMDENTLIANIVSGKTKPEDSTLLKVFDRNPQWKDMLVVCDVTGSMSPYTAQLLLWIKANQELRGMKNILFFNDDEENSTAQNVVDDTTGMWIVSSSNYKEVMNTAIEAMKKGSHYENNLEAVCTAVKRFPESKGSVLMIADNWEDPCDMKLLSYLKANKIPVRVILCGVTTSVNLNYLEIARETGGTFHTMEQDLKNLAEMKDGTRFKVGDVKIMLSKGKFHLIN